MIGFTTTVPVEIIYAANKRPVDLNNIFITSETPNDYIEQAERDGFPRNSCSWIKGIYSVVKNMKIDTIIGVVEGDCSNSKALLEVLELMNVNSLPFAYPVDRGYANLNSAIMKLCDYFKVSMEQCNQVKKKIDIVRKKLNLLDELTWKDNKVKGFENHLWLVSSSDFNGDYLNYNKLLDLKIDEIKLRKQLNESVRVGYIGVPPAFTDLHNFIESLDARIVYNEVQRQFAMCDSIGKGIIDTYMNYTYPYKLKHRLKDIKEQIKKRNIDCLIHYVQAFCFRGIEDIIVRKELDLPILTIEGDRIGNIDPRTKLRIEAFIDMMY